MIFTPKNKTPEEILIFIGFILCNNSSGYELRLQNPNRKTPIENIDIPRRRFHAYIKDNSIDFHQDRPSKRTHRAHNFGGPRSDLYGLFELIDESKDFRNSKGYKYLKRHAKFSIKI